MILDCGFWITGNPTNARSLIFNPKSKIRPIQNPQSKIQNPAAPLNNPRNFATISPSFAPSIFAALALW
jgi:hypothetical protein